MKRDFILIGSVFFACACGGEKFPLPEQTDDTDGTDVVSDTTYLQLQPVWGIETGYQLNQPQDILLGREPLIYVADTGNDRILMLDLAGNTLGQSQPVDNPVALTQDSKLNLLIVTDSNKIYRINLITVQHQIANAPVELVFNEVDNPDRRYTGIAAALVTLQNQAAIGYYATATGDDTKDNQVLIFPEKFDVRVPSAVNLEPNGLGILSAASPSGVTTLRDFSADFIFCMIGENSFKVQWITPGEFGFTARLNPAQGDFDLFEPGKFLQPQDVTVDPEGNIYVVDAAQDSLFKFSAAGDELQSFGGSGSGEKQFNQPHGVAFFDRTLYVADTGNNRIVRFKLSTDAR
jgi:DNA-binding beta-propeller fold protein YncE